MSTLPERLRNTHEWVFLGAAPANAALLQEAAAEIERLQADAARYQWLRGRVPGGTYRVMGIIYSEGGAGVDAGIDAAIAASQAESP